MIAALAGRRGPLWVARADFATSSTCPLPGQKRTSVPLSVSRTILMTDPSRDWSRPG